MKRLIKILLILFPAYLFAQTALTVLAFQRIDLRFEVFALLIITPAVQATVLWWATLRSRAPTLHNSLRELRSKQPWPGLLLLLDCAILVPSWLLGGWLGINLNQMEKLPTYYSGVKAIVAGALLLFFSGKGQWPGRDRGWLMLFGVGLGGYGIDCLIGWLEPLSGLVFSGWQLLFRWLFFYGLLLVISLLLLFKIQAVWSQKSAGAAVMVDWAVSFVLLGAGVVLIGFFNRPYLLAPWSTLVKTCGVLFMTAILMGCMQLVDPPFRPTNADRRRH